MKSRWWWIAIAAIFTAASVVAVYYLIDRDDDTVFAQSTCNPTTTVNIKQCIETRFGPGTPIDTLRRYIRGANFIWWATKIENDVTHIKFVLIRDDEFGPRRVAIVAEVTDNLIRNIAVRDQDQVEGW